MAVYGQGPEDGETAGALSLGTSEVPASGVHLTLAEIGFSTVDFEIASYHGSSRLIPQWPRLCGWGEE